MYCKEPNKHIYSNTPSRYYKAHSMIRIHIDYSINSLRKSSSAKGMATLNDPNDPNRPGELIVNFGGFQRKCYRNCF